MGNRIKAKGSSGAVTVGSLDAISVGISGYPGSARMAVPWVIECSVAATNTTESIIPVSSGLPAFKVIDGWALVSTIDADALWNIRTAAGDTGGTLVATFTHTSTGTVRATDAASTIARAPQDVIPSSTVGIFVDKTTTNTGVGTIYLLCVWT